MEYILGIIASLFAILISLLAQMIFVYIHKKFCTLEYESYICFIDEKTPFETAQEIRIINNHRAVILRKKKTSFGRSKNADIAIKDKKVSQDHFFIYQSKWKSYIVDCKSSNGTFVNNKQIKKQSLVSNDIIVAGGTSMRYEKRIKYR